jgi:transketolase
MPCWEIFREQPQSYRLDVLPEHCRARLAVEAASPFGWLEWVGDEGAVIGIERFGASAPAEEIFKRYGFTVDNIVRQAKTLVSK